MSNILFNTIDWEGLEIVEYAGEKGKAYWRTKHYAGLRIRLVEYMPGYVADHWCQRGHIVHCLEGEFLNELETGEKTLMTAGMTYVVSDNMSSHRSSSQNGARLMIVDGDFLK
jgi:hypothetical protein